MPKHLRNDHTLKSLLPWFALLGFLGIAMYVLLPVDFWLPEHKSRHHTVIKEEAATQLEDDLFIDGFPIEVDEPIASTPEPSPSETEAKAPITASGAEPPKAVPPSTQAEPKPPITVSGAEPPKAV
ncbi:MAG: M23 family peptidase, partial [Cardiobacteriaceae bacterium]|nr:M23 family peptidase [Cardiobacteriaceae bacterium]